MMRVGREFSETLGDLNTKTIGKLGKDETFIRQAGMTPPKDIH